MTNLLMYYLPIIEIPTNVAEKIELIARNFDGRAAAITPIQMGSSLQMFIKRGLSLGKIVESNIAISEVAVISKRKECLIR